MSQQDAYEALELPYGADFDSIRTNYKRLALKWHPDKHQNSEEAIQRFKSISTAYKRLTTPGNEDVHMSMADMFDLFQQIFFAKSLSHLNGYDSSDEDSDEDEDDDEDDDENIDYLSLFANRIKTKSDYKKQRPDPGQSRKKLTPEEIEKNAHELISEEEKEKKKAEKRRAKKKRQRERKRLEKQEQEKIELESKKKPSKSKTDSIEQQTKQEKIRANSHKNKTKGDSDSEEDFDPSSAFFTKVVSKKKKGDPPVPNQPKKDTKKDKNNPEVRKNQEESEADELPPVVLRSRQLAIRGNEMANLGHYSAAIELFSEAIKLDPRDFRFFGNRSYCYDRMQQYEKALKDADRAIHLASDWPKGYFRKGRALSGLKFYADAEQAFMQVLKLDRNCDDAMQELLRVRTYQLTEMGFTRSQAENAIRTNGTVQSALDSLLAGVAENALSNEVYVSDEEDFSVTPAIVNTGPKSPVIKNRKNTVSTSIPGIATGAGDANKMDPANPDGLTALWVGNVLPEVTEKHLTLMFSKYGTITNIRMLPVKYCAFVNFKTGHMASRAMQALQGAECAGQRLLIKFPDNPISNGGSASGATVLKKTATQPATTPNYVDIDASIDIKQTGPVNGDECYFWRTTGCHYANKCHYKHVPDHKGVDKKPWQRVK